MAAFKLGIAGTAKNSGKTTATAAIMQELRHLDKKFVLTSIGYDGENKDHVTGLQKPKLWAEKGDTVATSETAMGFGTAHLKTLQKTDMNTILGKVIISSVTAPGLVQTVGPNKSSEVERLGNILQDFGADVIIFDGALNRIAPFSETDGFILVTGASRTTDIERLALEAKTFWQISKLPILEEDYAKSLEKEKDVTLYNEDFEIFKQWSGSSLLSSVEAESFSLPDAGYLYIPGIINEPAIKSLADCVKNTGKRLTLVLKDTVKLMLAADALNYEDFFKLLEGSGIALKVVKRIKLLAITVNPFYPLYRVAANSYEPAYIDGALLKARIESEVDIPVINIAEEGAKAITDLMGL